MEKRKADWVIKSQAIFTGDGSEPISGCIAIRGDRILAVGDERQMEGYLGPNTKQIDAGDRLVLPGFHDFHLHLWIGSLAHHYADLSTCYSEEATVQKIAEFAEERPDDPWVLGFGWHHINWPDQQLPTRHSLDQQISDRPVFLLNEELHSAWLNTKALEMVGIDRATKDPSFGRIERDEKGEPTGFLYETAVVLALEALDVPIEKKDELMCGFLQQAASLGITSVSDMLPLPGFEAGDPAWYAQYEARGELTARIHFLIALDGDWGRAERMREQYQSDKLQFSGLKQFVDGVPLTYTGYLLEPYTDSPGEVGATLFERETYEKWIVEADRRGFRARLHACGDGAVRLALDCFEKARKVNGPRDARHCIEHIEVIDPADLGRFADLGVIASMQPEHMTAGSVDTHAYVDRLGPERIRYTWPIGSLQKSGAQLIFSSDYPVVELNPLVGIYRAVTRRQYDGRPVDGWHPQERITLADALTYYTKAPAYGVFREHELGTLEPGKKADIIILDRNLFSAEMDELLETKVELTMMDGKVVYRREGL
ncbi:amidohydrolase [Ammoniphilus oxalaticus]|uniref:amidohydrolase n=1 Tax=Ammoniphilus oxalaticus TaxID=66863 RepID=UPI000E75AC6D|nr:amidohydrolase [Ammoniphilus oxalaticus]